MWLVEAATAEEEAEAVALMLREAVETPGRTASLITPDRSLARRVAARLETWDIHAEDTAGQPFGATLAGMLLDLTATAVEKEFEPVALMALLKHPLCRAGMPAGDLRRAISAVELAAFRSPYFGKGLDGVEAALERCAGAPAQPRAVRRLGAADWQAARELLRRLKAIFAADGGGLRVGLALSRCRTLPGLHFATAEALAKTSDTDDGSALRRGEAGEWAAQFFASLIDKSMPAPHIAAFDYPAFYRTMVAEQAHPFAAARPPAHRNPRSSRRTPAAQRRGDPGRAQRRHLAASGRSGPLAQSGDAPGPRHGRCPKKPSAPRHTISAGKPGRSASVLTRAAKVDGAPTVASRWVLRLQALVKGMGLSLQAEQPWLAWAKARNPTAGRRRPVRAPEPRPPVAMRPRELSVTTVETWIANPYAVFARRILRLEPLPLLGARPAAFAARPDRARRAAPLRRALSEPIAERHRTGADGDRRGSAGRLHRQSPRGGVLGAAARPLRRLVRRNRACSPHRHCPHVVRGRAARWFSRARSGHSR